MATFDYRRELTSAERTRTLAAGVGVGVAAAVAATYLARILLQRTRVAPGAAPAGTVAAGSGPEPVAR